MFSYYGTKLLQRFHLFHHEGPWNESKHVLFQQLEKTETYIESDPDIRKVVIIKGDSISILKGSPKLAGRHRQKPEEPVFPTESSEVDMVRIGKANGGHICINVCMERLDWVCHRFQGSISLRVQLLEGCRGAGGGCPPSLVVAQIL